MSTGRGILPSYLGLCWCNFLFLLYFGMGNGSEKTDDSGDFIWPGETRKERRDVL